MDGTVGVSPGKNRILNGGIIDPPGENAGNIGIVKITVANQPMPGITLRIASYVEAVLTKIALILTALFQFTIFQIDIMPRPAGPGGVAAYTVVVTIAVGLFEFESIFILTIDVDVHQEGATVHEDREAFIALPNSPEAASHMHSAQS